MLGCPVKPEIPLISKYCQFLLKLQTANSQFWKLPCVKTFSQSSGKWNSSWFTLVREKACFLIRYDLENDFKILKFWLLKRSITLPCEFHQTNDGHHQVVRVFSMEIYSAFLLSYPVKQEILLILKYCQFLVKLQNLMANFRSENCHVSKKHFHNPL